MPGLSLRAAINAKCKDCCYDPRNGGGTWRQQVGLCSAVTCGLWPVRPRSSTNRHRDDLQHPPEAPLPNTAFPAPFEAKSGG